MKKTLILILAITLVFSVTVFAGEVWKAVTPDGKETEIGKIKVRRSFELSAENLAVVKTIIPDFELPKAEMYRLEKIDADISVLIAQRAAHDKIIEALQAIRVKVETEAKKVILKGE